MWGDRRVTLPLDNWVTTRARTFWVRPHNKSFDGWKDWRGRYPIPAVCRVVPPPGAVKSNRETVRLIRMVLPVRAVEYFLFGGPGVVREKPPDCFLRPEGIHLFLMAFGRI